SLRPSPRQTARSAPPSSMSSTPPTPSLHPTSRWGDSESRLCPARAKYYVARGTRYGLSPVHCPFSSVSKLPAHASASVKSAAVPAPVSKPPPPYQIESGRCETDSSPLAERCAAPWVARLSVLLGLWALRPWPSASVLSSTRIVSTSRSMKN